MVGEIRHLHKLFIRRDPFTNHAAFISHYFENSCTACRVSCSRCYSNTGILGRRASPNGKVGASSNAMFGGVGCGLDLSMTSAITQIRPTRAASGTLTAAEVVASVDMANVLNEEKKQQILALGRLGWPLRQIQKA